MLFQVTKKKVTHGAFLVVGLTLVLIGFLSVIKGMDKTEGVSFRELNDEMAKIPQLKEAIFIRRHQTDRFGSALISDKFSIYSSIGVVEKYDGWLTNNGWVPLTKNSFQEREYCKGKMTAALEINENTRSFSFSISWSRYAPSRCLRTLSKLESNVNV